MEKVSYLNNLYPNPSNGLVTLEINNYEKLTIEVIDQKGVIVKSLTTNSTIERIELYDLPAGLYIIRAYDQYKNYDEKRVILNK